MADDKGRIVIFNGNFFSISETFIYRQVKPLHEKFQVLLLGYQLQNRKHFDFDHLRFVKVPKIGVVHRINRVLLKAFNFDFNYKILSWFVFKRFLTGKNTIVHAHYGWNGLFILPYLRQNNIPLVVSFHGNDASAWLRKPGIKDKLPALFKYASAIIVCSNHMINTLQIGEYGDKVKVIPYGINLSEFTPSTERRNNDKIILLHAGRIVQKKGVMDLILVYNEMQKKFFNIELHVIGEGSQKQECELLVGQLNLNGKVFFYGAQPQPVVKKFLADCDIFILNSRTAASGDMEGLPNAILEAMACGKPVVSTRHAGIPMAVVDGVTGLLVEESNNDQLQSAIERMIQDRQLRDTLGKNGRERAEKYFTEELMSEALVAVFDDTFAKS